MNLLLAFLLLAGPVRKTCASSLAANCEKPLRRTPSKLVGCAIAEF